ncbi:MAG: fibronectin type III domain-containing protein [Candidatus Dadabacteria bacterium]|nr:fibronectin type III domain-containing protein [Candidatus Dadabacteria bacterium]
MALQSDRLYKGMEANMRKILMVLTTGILLIFSAVSLAVPDGSPEAPGGLAAAAADGQVTLSWTTPADNASTIIRYEYRVSDDGGTSWNPDWTEVPSSDVSTTTHAVDSLTNGTVYTFGVRAVNANGAGGGGGGQRGCGFDDAVWGYGMHGREF